MHHDRFQMIRTPYFTTGTPPGVLSSSFIRNSDLFTSAFSSDIQPPVRALVFLNGQDSFFIPFSRPLSRPISPLTTSYTGPRVVGKMFRKAIVHNKFVPADTASWNP